MITYSVDQNQDSQINSELREIASELATVATSLQRLQSVVARHEETINAPSIAEFRNNLNLMVSDASSLTRRISQNALTLIDVSEQARKQLTSIEQEFSSLLREQTPLPYLASSTSTHKEQ